MKNQSLYPIVGMNTVSRFDQLTKSDRTNGRKVHVRDAVNVDLDDGKIEMRKGARQVSDKPLQYLWTSPLHNDTFGVLDGAWVLVNRSDWSLTPLTTLGHGPVAHCVLNQSVLVSGDSGLWRYDGTDARRFTLPRPPAPALMAIPGSLAHGTWSVAITWLNAQGEESARSRATQLDASGLRVTLPLPLDQQVTRVRIYVSNWNDGALRLAEELPAAITTVDFPLLGTPGQDAPPSHLEPMPGGHFLAQWGGRLVTASGRTLRFSQPLDYARHDPRHDFVQLPQRIRFVVALGTGIWVGQSDHVVFLAGSGPNEMQVMRKAARPPFPGSAVMLDAELVGEASAGGRQCALWMSDNGYVLGTETGEIVELHAGVLSGLEANRAATAVCGRRVFTLTG